MTADRLSAAPHPVTGTLSAFTAAWGQLPSRGFLRVLAISLGAAVVALAALWWGLDHWLSSYTGIATQDHWWARAAGWLANHGAAGLVLLASWFLLPALTTTVMGALLDDIVDAVEQRHYPAHPALHPIGMGLGAWLGLTSGLRMIGINFLLIPVYIVLAFTVIGPFALYLVVNGYLLGRDYLQMVAVRHLGTGGDRAFRARNTDGVFAVGLATSGLLLVPGINLLAPLIGAAMATHVFHQRHANR